MILGYNTFLLVLFRLSFIVLLDRFDRSLKLKEEKNESKRERERERESSNRIVVDNLWHIATIKKIYFFVFYLKIGPYNEMLCIFSGLLSSKRERKVLIIHRQLNRCVCVCVYIIFAGGIFSLHIWVFHYLDMACNGSKDRISHSEKQERKQEWNVNSRN